MKKIEKIEIKNFHDSFTHITQKGYVGTPVTLAEKLNEVINKLNSHLEEHGK